MKISAILLAGGIGSRMGSSHPKQFLPLQGKTIALHSLEVLLQMEEIKEIIVVCAPEYRSLFAKMPVCFADPGKERQHSVYHGLQKAAHEWICTHDSARPFITKPLVKELFDEGRHVAASSLAMPVKNTLKEITPSLEVVRTLDRSVIWEIQTPQLVKKEVLEAAFEHVHRHHLRVTDDVSLAELMGHQAKLIRGSYQNIKITTPEDLQFAEWLMHSNTACALPMMAHATAAGRSSPIAIPSKKS